MGAVLFCSCTSAKMMPSLATWLSGRLGMFQTHASCDIVAACAGLLGIAAAFTGRRGAGLATAALALIVLLLVGV